MKFFLAMLLLASTLLARDVLHVFGYAWSVPFASDWRIERDNGTPVLHLFRARGPLPGPRRPIQFALAETAELNHVTVDLDARPLEKSLILVFAYRDSAHFDYAHLSTDSALTEPHHNGIFHVYGGERVRISSQQGTAAFSASKRWYHIDLIYDGASGKVQVAIDGQSTPALSAIDSSLGVGKVGLGSFDETADFKNVKIEVTKAR